MCVYFVSGASASGKSSIIPYLKDLLGDNFVVFEFDSIGVPKGADTKWRQQATEQWLQRIIKEEKNAVLVGQMVLGEILACPSVSQLDCINYCFLDVDDKERIRRLTKRDGKDFDQHVLPWAAWLREHHKNPQYKQHVIKDGSWDGLNFAVWDTLKNWYAINIMTIDTTEKSLQEVALIVKKQIERKFFEDSNYR